MTPAASDTALDAGESRAVSMLRRFGDHSSMALALNRDVHHFFDSDGRGMVAYRRSGGHLVQICGPFCAAADRRALLDAFLTSAEREGSGGVTAIQLRRGDAELYARRGFSVNQFGCSYSIELETFTLRGTKFMKVRNKISRARRLGVKVGERPDAGADAELDEIDHDWLRGKGFYASELAFLVGERGGAAQGERRVFVAHLEGKPLAYVTYSPVYGSERPGWLYDLTRRCRDVPPGTIELIFASALETVREEGCEWLHMGLTPFVGLSEENELISARSRVVSFLAQQLAERGSAVYPAKTQEAFKMKWAPTAIEPEYIAFRGGPSLRGTVALLRLTRVIPW
jgi:lysylphosphatidylglycerol synthetase-like protein (DUF2156 family)